MYAQLGISSVTVFWDWEIMWDYYLPLSIESSHNPGDIFPIGYTNVNYMGLDKFGTIIITDSFSIHVTG